MASTVLRNYSIPKSMNRISQVHVRQTIHALEPYNARPSIFQRPSLETLDLKPFNFVLESSDLRVQITRFVG
jgi:hypothetical protein